MRNVDERLLAALARTLADLERPLAHHLKQADLTPGQFAVLQALMRLGPSTVNALIAETQSTSGNLGVVVDNLVKSGLLKKTGVKSDGRKREVALTPLGQKKAAEYAPQHTAELKRLLKGATLDDKHKLLRSLKSITVACDKPE